MKNTLLLFSQSLACTTILQIFPTGHYDKKIIIITTCSKNGERKIKIHFHSDRRPLHQPWLWVGICWVIQCLQWLWPVEELLYITSLTTFKIPLCFVHSVTLLRRFMRAILRSNKPTEGGHGGQLFNLFHQIWLDLSFVVWQRLYMVTNKRRQKHPLIHYDFREPRSRFIPWSQ